MAETGDGGRGKLWSHGGEHSKGDTEGKAERLPQRGSMPTSTHQPERLICSPTSLDGWGLGVQVLASSEVRSQGEDWGWLHEHSLKGAKTKAEPQELCEQRREREISPSSLKSSGLNLHNQLDVLCISGYLNRQ